MISSRRTLPPAIILGGDANALSVARSLATMGVRVWAMAEDGSNIRYCRYCRCISVPPNGRHEDAWASYLLGEGGRKLAGAVVLACSDAGIRALARHRGELGRRFILDLSDPASQLAMLDKLTTYQHAVAAGIPTPRFWVADSPQQALELRGELVYPLIVKPRLGHLAVRSHGRKHSVVHSFPELQSVLRDQSAAGVPMVLMEQIGGPDSLLCSYYTYIDESGTPMLDFTKRIIRRYPEGMGPACYHITESAHTLETIVRQSQALLRHVGLRGLANIEYKLDVRDGSYKIIECNARFTAANCLVRAAGIDLARFVYARLVGLPTPPVHAYRKGLRLWDPALDLLAFVERRPRGRDGQMTLRQWLSSVWHHQTFPFFAWSDPMPAVGRGLKLLRLMLTPAAGSPASAAPSPQGGLQHAGAGA